MTYSAQSLSASIIICILYDPTSSSVIYAEQSQKQNQNQPTPNDIASATADSPNSQNAIK